MNKISYGQLFTLLIILRGFSLVCSAQPADSQQMAGAALSIAFQLLAAIPMLLLYRHNDFSIKNQMLMGKVGKLLYALFFIIWGAVSFTKLWGVTKSVYFPINSSLLGAILLAAVCLYASCLGLSALARCSTIVFGFLIFSIGVLILGAYSKINIINLIPNAEFNGVLKSALTDFCTSGELPALFILLEYTKNNRTKGTVSFFAGKFFLIELVSFIEITVLGKLMSVSDYPFFSAGAYSQPFSIQRADALYMILFTLMCIVSVTLHLILTSMLIKDILPKFKYNTLLSIILMLSLSAVMNSSGIKFDLIWGVLILILSLFIPLIMLLRRRFKNEKASSASSGSTDTQRLSEKY